MRDPTHVASGDTGASPNSNPGTGQPVPGRAMTELAALVPRLAVELGEQPGNVAAQLDGSMLSADISGFTALSERLADKGKKGAEEITGLINQCFSALIDAAYRYDAEVLKFGGDAILVLFRGEHHAVRAGAAALAMQEALRASAAARRAELTMTVGVADGPFEVFLVGEPRRELLIGGPNASEVIHLESSAAKGATLASPSIATALSTQLTNMDGGGLIMAPHTPGRGHDLTDEDLKPFVPGSVLEQLRAFSDIGGEHRMVSIGFVMLGGLDDHIASHGLDATGEALSHFINATRDACVEFQVTFLHSDIASNGGKLILAAGAPLTSGSDEDAMIRATLSIAATETPFVVKIGVQRGRVFAGFLGSTYRSAYTVMGDAVNTAARLLGRCEPGQVIVANDALQAAQSIYRSTALEPFMVKGKQQPLVAHVVHEPTSERRTHDANITMVGRSGELRLLREKLSYGGAVHVTGQPGSGKTRLLSAALATDAAHSAGAQVRGACNPYGARSPYGVFRDGLRQALNIAPADTPPVAGAQLFSFVGSHAPQLLQWLPLLATVLNAEVSPTPEVEALDPSFRRAQLHRSVADLLQHLGAPLVVVEDTQWIDDASGDLLSHFEEVANKQDGWSVLSTSREQGLWQTADHSTDVALTPLSDTAVRQIAIEASTRALSDHELGQIIRQASGNPLFAIELSRALSLDPNASLPASVEDLFATRIDTLPPDVRRVLRMAAVMGRNFRLEDLEELADEQQLVDTFLPLVADIVTSTGKGRYAWTNALYRDAAYESLPFKSRKKLHEQVGSYLEAQEKKPDTIAALLGFHFHEARIHAKTWHYSTIAGKRAVAKDAHVEAAEVFERALEASRWLPDLTNAEVVEIAEATGDAHLQVGDYEASFKAFDRGRKQTEADLSKARLLRKSGTVRQREGKIPLAQKWYQRALAALEENTQNADSAEVLTELAEAHVALAGGAHRRGDNQACWDWAEKGANAAKQAGSTRLEAYAYDMYQTAGTHLGRSEALDYGRLSLEKFAEVGDSNGESSAANNLGVQAYYRGDWDEAAEYYARGESAASRAGNVLMVATIANNLGEIFADQGHTRKARERFAESERMFGAAGFALGQALSLFNQGYLAMRTGDAKTGRDLLQDSVTGFDDVGADSFSFLGHLRLAECDLIEGKTAAAAKQLDKLIKRLERDDPDNDLVRSTALRLRSRAARDSGDTDGALTMANDALAAATQASADYERSLCLFTKASAIEDLDQPDEAQELRQEAEAIMDGLGILGGS